MLELYHHGSSVCAAKVRWGMVEKELDFDAHYVDILKGEQFTPEYLALNPKGVVPTIVHDGNVVIESTVILEYLDLVFPEKKLTPEDPMDYVKTRFWTKALDEYHAHLLRNADVRIGAPAHRAQEPERCEEVEEFLANTPSRFGNQGLGRTQETTRCLRIRGARCRRDGAYVRRLPAEK